MSFKVETGYSIKFNDSHSLECLIRVCYNNHFSCDPQTRCQLFDKRNRRGTGSLRFGHHLLQRYRWIHRYVSGKHTFPGIIVINKCPSIAIYKNVTNRISYLYKGGELPERSVHTFRSHNKRLRRVQSGDYRGRLYGGKYQCKHS